MISGILKLSRRPAMIRLITLGDQCMFAAGNFLLTVLLTRFYTDIDLAAYGIALSIALVLQGVQKNTYVIQHSVMPPEEFRRRSNKIMAEHFIATQPLFILLTILSAFIVAGMPQTLETHTIIATTVCFAIYAQLEFERIVLIKYEKYLVPFLTSMAFLLMTIGFLFYHAQITFYDLMLCLWIFAVLKTLLLIALVGLPDIRGGWEQMREDFQHNMKASVQGVIGASGYIHGPVLILGALAAPAQVAAYVAMRSLMQPTQIVMRSLDVIDKNFFHSKSAGTDDGIRRTMISQMMRYTLISAAMAMMICGFGNEIIQLLFAGKHQNFIYVLYGWGALSVFMAVVAPIESVLIIKNKLNKYNFIRLWIGIMTVLLCYPVAIAFGAHGIILISLAAGIAAVFAGYYIANQTQGDEKK